MRKALACIGGESSNIIPTTQPLLAQKKDILNNTSISAQNNVPKLVLDSNDKEKAHDLLGVEPYKDDIYKYLKKIEAKYLPMPNYMIRHKCITRDMRCILVDWLVDVTEEFGFNTETLFKTVFCIDRCLSLAKLNATEFQLLGVTSLLIASKLEEVDLPTVDDLVSICDDAYEKKKILSMEQELLKILDYNVTGPTIYTFINHIAAVKQYPSHLKNIASFFAEQAIVWGDPFIAMKPSLVASGCLALARKENKWEVWPSELSALTGYSFNNIDKLITQLNQNKEANKALKLTAVYDKYRTAGKDCVSLLY